MVQPSSVLPSNSEVKPDSDSACSRSGAAETAPRNARRFISVSLRYLVIGIGLRRPPLSLQVPGLAKTTGQILAGGIVADDPLSRVVPLKPMAGPERDVCQQTVLRQVMSIANIACRLQVPGLDGVEELPYV